MNLWACDVKWLEDGSIAKKSEGSWIALRSTLVFVWSLCNRQSQIRPTNHQRTQGRRFCYLEDYSRTLPLPNSSRPAAVSFCVELGRKYLIQSSIGHKKHRSFRLANSMPTKKYIQGPEFIVCLWCDFLSLCPLLMSVHTWRISYHLIFYLVPPL